MKATVPANTVWDAGGGWGMKLRLGKAPGWAGRSEGPSRRGRVNGESEGGG
jgi:hypothetical protein